MDGSDFTQLLDEFAATVCWQQAFPCPCTLDTGAADRSCLICGGTAKYRDEFSEPFEVAILNQSARERAHMAQTMGPGQLGESVLVVFENCPCYNDINGDDRVWDVEKLDTQRLIVRPGVAIMLPPMFQDLRALVKSSDGQSLVSVPPPVPDANRRVRVDVVTRLDFIASRGYEVINDLTRIRTFGNGLPKRLPMRKLDLSAR